MRYLFAIVALGLLIAFHELGHLLAARLFGIRVLQFSIGFGPPLFKVRRGETDYTIGAVPLGGFVRIHGMNPHEEIAPDDSRAFSAKLPWQRLLVLVAGSAANYLLALVVLVALHLAGTHVPVPMAIGAVEPGSEAARAQLRPGDVIVSVDGEKVDQWSALVTRVNDSPDRPLVLGIARGGEQLEVRVRPRPDPAGVGRLGIHQQYVYRQHAFGDAVGAAFTYANRLVIEGATLMWRLVSLQGGVELSSPVGIVKQASAAASAGLDAFLRVLVAISVALAFFNLLPIPALDGGRALFVAIELASGRKVNPKVETLLHTVGFVLLIALILVVAFNDLRRAARAPEEGERGIEAIDAGTEG